MASITEYETEQLQKANATGRTPGFANAVSEDEANELYNTFAVPAPGASLSQAATANLNPWEGVTEIVEIPNRGHALTTDIGWPEVADTALRFVRRFCDPG